MIEDLTQLLMVFGEMSRFEAEQATKEYLKKKLTNKRLSVLL